ncbi:helix-turn-helix domain-containing protein [Rhodospirillum sp. A1_3_36]|uniref:AraC-like ligand-binding domain-containing protein n=1 Tax=Rhodospirillum sp. A1_3_36 TaxID=3391666 RepID=UPI0039A6E9A0
MELTEGSSDWWNSDGLPMDIRTESWRGALQESYGAWDVPRRLDSRFSARMRRFQAGETRLIECHCSPCSGVKSLKVSRNDHDRQLGIQIVLSGRERFRSGEDRITASPGDMVVWTSDHPIEFEVTEPLHKVTFMVPMRRVLDVLPKGGQVRRGLINGRSGLGGLLSTQMRAMCGELGEMDGSEAAAAGRATLELATTILADGAEGAPSGLAAQYLANVRAYLVAHLHEEDLSLSRAAEANRISLRYLHMLFHPTGESASAWILEQRLERCRMALEDPRFDTRKISEIGWRWGFKDASSFSRAFKLRYGMTPRDYRASWSGNRGALRGMG